MNKDINSVEINWLLILHFEGKFDWLQSFMY